jgi:Cu+-exporting ATPase
LVDSQTLLTGTFSEVWSYMASAEQASEHGIGKAIVAHARNKLKTPLLEARGFCAVPGCGVQCEIDGRSVSVGSMKWLNDVLHVKIPGEFVAANDGFSHHDGCVVVFCAVDGALKAAVALKDAPRDEATLVVDALRRERIQPWIVTGDQRGTALAVADELGIPEFTVLADTLPHQKVEKVRLLQGIGKKVAFIGDGVNDGPALAMANVGVAIGAGTDVAIDAADVVLVKDDLRDFLNALHLSRATNRMIRWNFTWAFLYNLIMMPIACGALYPWLGIAIPPALAGLSELLSSVPVILFSLLLNWWRPPFSANDHSHLLAHGRGAYVAIDVRSDGCESGDGCCSSKKSKADEKTPLLPRSR